MARGRAARPIRRIPRAIAPDVTSATSSPAACRSATWPQTESRTFSRSAPSASATIDEPSFAITVIAGQVYGRFAWPPGGWARTPKRIKIVCKYADAEGGDGQSPRPDLSRTADACADLHRCRGRVCGRRGRRGSRSQRQPPPGRRALRDRGGPLRGGKPVRGLRAGELLVPAEPDRLPRRLAAASTVGDRRAGGPQLPARVAGPPVPLVHGRVQHRELRAGRPRGAHDRPPRRHL